MVAREVFSSADQTKDDGEARGLNRKRREEKGANPWAAGAFLRSLFLRGAADALVRIDRACAEWPYDCAHAKTREEAPDGACRAHLRSGNDWSLFQYGCGNRRRRPLPPKISQAPHSSLPPGLLGKILFHARECRLSRLRNALRSRRRLHLLRPTFS